MNETNEIDHVAMPVAEQIQRYLEHIKQWPPELFAIALAIFAGYVCRRTHVIRNKWLYWASVVTAMLFYAVFAKYTAVGIGPTFKQVLFNLIFGAAMGAVAGLAVQLVHDKAFAPLAAKVPFFNFLIAEDSRDQTTFLKNPNPPDKPAQPPKE